MPSSQLTQPRIAVVGAGIGGLTFALAMREHGLDVQIFEQTDQLREVGAAVALSGNATRFYEKWGLGEELAGHWQEVEALIFRDARDGRKIGRHPVGSSYRARFGGPYVGIHRAALQAVLSGAVGAERIHLGRQVVDVTAAAAHATLHFADGDTTDAELVIGADGARSGLRRQMLGYDDALYSGCSGFRGVVPVEDLPSLPDPDALQFWMGPGGHLLHYPIGGDINFLLVEREPSPWPHAAWNAPANEGDQLRRFADWHPAIVEMITAVPISLRWGLFHRPTLSRWTKGRITLLGDAAHTMTPHHGQGANQAIEDAVCLAGCLADSDPGGWDEALHRYEQLRRGRTRKVQYASVTVPDVLHLPDGPRAERRNDRLATTEGTERHLIWIHDFDVSKDAPTDQQGGTWL